ncbi:class I SAM-dependent methyltransferase [Mucilaginibacter sp. SP1R1]|uniref:class I SAM-dependent methyltransferase n=1 Tax=Mucilaginibacter sp. SP1R1 TaxID=2723091 RepID=UPI00161BE10E|nr:class I SAM-dependent methyltransferase [Mucilaginibacter sp. SP1R1]MBB6151366.1 ubiquinone/menaquinone biosynthesis C-methylase UbiE [Mucilaginibacter sp. SP1R1]
MEETRIDIAPVTHQQADEALEEMYIAIREIEGRVYTDKQVAQLPDMDSSHPYFKEWKMRQQSSQRLIAHLQMIKQPLQILEVGCGNGWLASKLAQIPNVKVTAIDTNRIEIEQAKRVFRKPNLQFIHQGFNRNSFNSQVKFDIIIFAASLQYFSSVRVVIGDAFKLLNQDGKVHILDTPFYQKDKVDQSVLRCQKYYTDMGFADMATHYFHHTLHKFNVFHHKILFDPGTLWNRLTKKGVFYWIVLKP